MFVFDDSFLDLFSSNLVDRYQKINISGVFSESKLVSIGVPQGFVLGPLLFLFLINDLPRVFLDCIPYHFADDLNMLFDSLNFDNDLTQLQHWNLEIGMILNSLKLKVLVLSCSVTPTLILCDEGIETVESYKDLVIIIDKKFK